MAMTNVSIDPMELAADSGLCKALLAALPPDAPKGHESYEKVKWRKSTSIAVFRYNDGNSGGEINFQTTMSACGSKYATQRVARSCYMRFESHESKDQVLEFRARCYSRLQAVTGGKPQPPSKHKLDVAESEPAKHRKVDTMPKAQACNTSNSATIQNGLQTQQSLIRQTESKSEEVAPPLDMKSVEKMPLKAKVKALAQHCGCDEYVAQEALSQAKRNSPGNAVEAATRLLRTGAKEVYISEAANVSDTYGDTVFQNAYVKCLLEAARVRVRESLAEQPGPEADRWLICVRTYGRARSEAQPELEDWLRKVGVNKLKVPHLGDVLRRIGIKDSDKCKVAFQSPEQLMKRVEDAGLKLGFNREKFTKQTKAWCEQDERKAATLSAKIGRSTGRNPGLRDMTLHALERALGPDAFRRCLIFVSHEDADFVSGRYARSLKGTPWENRVVMGIKGAHLQVRFIEEAAPIGTHIVVADDNIDALVTEVAEESQKLKGKQGGEYWHRALDSKNKQGPLDGTGLRILGEESELSRFVRACWPKKWDEVKKASALKDVEQRLRQEGINCPAEFVDRSSAQSTLLSKIIGVKRMFQPTVEAQQQRPLPPGRILVGTAQADPQKQKHVKKNVEKEVPELAALISRAGRAMTDHGANLWSVSCSQNHHFLHEYGESMRALARKCGVFQDTTSKLGLIYGAFFGFKVLHDRRRYTRFGQVKDDVERTLRYWHCDGILLRFQRYAVLKRHPPGKFNAKKGGISAATGSAGHEEEGRVALRNIIASFAWRYARLPVPGENYSDVGLIWLPKTLRQKADTPDEEAPPLPVDVGPLPKRPPTCRPLATCRPTGSVIGTTKSLVADSRLGLHLKRPAAAASAEYAKWGRHA